MDNYLSEEKHNLLCKLLLKIESNPKLPQAIRRTAKGLYSLITRYWYSKD